MFFFLYSQLKDLIDNKLDNKTIKYIPKKKVLK